MTKRDNTEAFRQIMARAKLQPYVPQPSPNYMDRMRAAIDSMTETPAADPKTPATPVGVDN